MQVPCPSGSRSDLERLLVQYYMYWKRLYYFLQVYLFFFFFFIYEFLCCHEKSVWNVQISTGPPNEFLQQAVCSEKWMYVYLHLNVATSENYSDITQLTLRFHVYRKQPSISLHATITCSLKYEINYFKCLIFVFIISQSQQY